MRLLASDIITYFRPECGLKFFLQNQGIKPAEPSAYDRVLASLGTRHEQNHAASLGPYADLNGFRDDQLVAETKAAIQKQAQVIYQGGFQADTTINGQKVTVFGRPDFLLLDGDAYVIRDAKLSRKIDDDNHIEIVRQVQLYGWLYEKTTEHAPKRLEVYNGKGEITVISYDKGKAALAVLAEIIRWKIIKKAPYEPVGWSKCGECGYGECCLKKANAAKDVALLPEVDQSLARALHQRGIKTYRDLHAGFDVAQLSAFQRPWGTKAQKVGKRAEKILIYAEVMDTGKERVLSKPVIPDCPNYVMFDLEGLPPHQNDLEKIYLWGMQVYGKVPSNFMAPLAGFGENGDKEGWITFLTAAEDVFKAYRDLPFVHWGSYEKTNLDRYIARYGDPNGTAARVKRNLLDLLPITKAAIALPIPSYSLKVIEQYVGFRRTQTEFGGDWSMATFIEATETNDKKRRAALMNNILKYNEEDLAATWAVLEWLRGKKAEFGAAHV
jgi:predicted RecB family nuclease